MNIAVLASTNGTDLQAIIDEINAGTLKDINLKCVISNKQNCYALERARIANIEAIFIDSKNKEREIYDQEISIILNQKNIDYIILVGYMRLFNPWFVQQYKNKIINIHPSLLPSFAGMDLDVHQAVLDYGCKITGCTIHFIDEGMDTGPIIMQKTTEIDNNETPESLKTKVQSLEKKWYPQVIRLLRDKKIIVNNRKVKIISN